MELTVWLFGPEVEWRRSVFYEIDTLHGFVERAFLLILRLSEPARMIG